MSRPAPELIVEKWFNTEKSLSLAGLRGRPVLIHAFQMLCPGCVIHAIPQARKVAQVFQKSDLAVIGLHAVFEHHAAMTPVSLEAFLHEFGIAFPVGIDKASENSPIPQTMAAYGFQGTPSTVLIDREGLIRYQGFGQEDDLALGFHLGSLLNSGAGE